MSEKRKYDCACRPRCNTGNKKSISEPLELCTGCTFEGYDRGGVITMSWHMWNPVTGENYYDTTPAVHAIIPGGERHEYYKSQLDTLALFFHSLRSEKTGDLAPVIFRPFHEHNGDWFWWCKVFTTEEDFITLWQFTVEYLRDVKEVHNLLYSISPERSRINLDDFVRFREDRFVMFEDDLPDLYSGNSH